MNLLEASHQWQSRPPDQRFSNIRDMRNACYHYFETAHESSADPEDVSINAVTHAATRNAEQHEEPVLQIDNQKKGSNRARFTNWSFGQLCRIIGAPADYIRGLPVDLSIRNLRHGIGEWQKKPDRTPVKLLTNENGGNLLRAITSTGYSRVWNHEVADRLMELGEDWIVPPARPAFENQPGSRRATKADILPNQGDFGLSVKVGDMIAPAGIYASDHDMFVFLVNEQARIADGSGLGLAKGMFISNSEVGAQSLKITKFRYRHVCGNHICWDASGVIEVRIVHRGSADARFIKELSMELLRYGEEGVGEEEAFIQIARNYTLGADKDEVLDVLFGIKNLGPTRGQLDQAYDIAEENENTDGEPNTAWGMVNGLTRLSQQISYTDQRVKLDMAAGKILKLVKS